MNKVEPMQASELLQPNQLAEMDTWFLTPGYQASTNRYTLVFEVDEATWLQFKTSVPKGSLVHQRFFFNDGEASDAAEAAESEMEEKPAKPKREKKPPKPKGEFGAYWRLMVQRGAFYSPELWTALNVDGSDEKAVKAAFLDNIWVHGGTAYTSRTFISPAIFEKWAEANNLAQLVTMSRLAASEVGL